MTIDYKKELETAAKSMILVHDPNVLIKMIVRLVVHKVKVRHAGIVLHHSDRDTYILSVSRGPLGVKIPEGFARMDKDNPLIRLFREQSTAAILDGGALDYQSLKERMLTDQGLSPDVRTLIERVLYQLEMFDVSVCIPIQYRDELLGILLLGNKEDNLKLGRDELDFFIALASDVAMAINNARLFKDLEDELKKRHDLFINTTIAFAAAIEAKDYYTHGHTARVTSISLEIAKRMRKEYVAINAKFLEDLHISALLHDIGKIGIPERILNKEGPLTPEEWMIMKTHPTIGANILQPINELEHAILGVKYHHERYDGKGYPEGLTNGNIPMNAAIIAAADSYDAMTSDRPYRKAKDKEVAIAEIQNLAGQQFHPHVANALVQIYKDGKI